MKQFSLIAVQYFEIHVYCTLSILQIGEEKSTVIGLMRKAIAQQFTDEVSKLRQFLASFLHVNLRNTDNNIHEKITQFWLAKRSAVQV